MQTQDGIDVQTLFAVVDAQVDENGLLAGEANFKITVQYEADNGHTLCRTGQVWACDTDGMLDKLRFSIMQGDDEDSHFMQLRGQIAELVSVDDYGTGHKLGEVKNVEIK